MHDGMITCVLYGNAAHGIPVGDPPHGSPRHSYLSVVFGDPGRLRHSSAWPLQTRSVYVRLLLSTTWSADPMSSLADPLAFPASAGPTAQEDAPALSVPTFDVAGT